MKKSIEKQNTMEVIKNSLRNSLQIEGIEPTEDNMHLDMKKYEKENEMIKIGKLVATHLISKGWRILSNWYNFTKSWEEFRSLTKTDYSNPPRPDILLIKDGEYFCIECKTVAGTISKSQCKWSDFRRAVSEIITFAGDETNRVRLGLALHVEFKDHIKKLPERVRKLLKIELFFVNPSTQEVKHVNHDQPVE